MKKLIPILVIVILTSFTSDKIPGSIRGTLTESETGEVIPFANVTLLIDGNQILGTTTDFE